MRFPWVLWVRILDRLEMGHGRKTLWRLHCLALLACVRLCSHGRHRRKSVLLKAHQKVLVLKSRSHLAPKCGRPNCSRAGQGSLISFGVR